MDFIYGCRCRYLAYIMYVYIYVPEEYKDIQQDGNCASLDGRIMAAFDFFLLIYLFSFKNHLYVLIM